MEFFFLMWVLMPVALVLNASVPLYLAGELSLMKARERALKREYGEKVDLVPEAILLSHGGPKQPSRIEAKGGHLGSRGQT